MVDLAGKLYRFGEFQLDASDRILSDGTRTIPLPPKIFDTLLLLVENAGKALGKDEMMHRIWSDSFVEENNLAQNISVLRRTFGEDAGFIETIPKRGYRFVAPVEILDGGPGLERVIGVAIGDGVEQMPDRIPETHYVQNGDVNIAYQVIGEGDIDIVFVMGWISHLEYFWKHHLFESFLGRLASFSRLILFDKRGTGLSDRVPIDFLPTLEQRMEDVHVVMDAVGSERAVLIGVSEGGPMCSLFAATYPERTSALVMIGTYAKRIRDDDYPWALTTEQREAFFELMKREWGKPIGIEERAPSMANDPEFRDWWATYLRMGASPGAAVALTKMNAEIDVRNVLPSVRVPTLVIHRKDDMCLKIEEGRYVASKIPGSKFVELEGDDHLPFVGDQEEILDEIERFVTGTPHSGEHDRVLATVMCFRIVDEPEFALEVTNWEDLVKRSGDYVRRQIELFKGREISFDESGMLVTFDGPARAIRFACAIMDSVERLNIPVKTGLHTGECDVVDGKYSGFAVELAQKIAGESEIGCVLVSRTVKDLVAGSGLVFEEFGQRSFDGIDGEWRLFTVNR